MVCGISTERNIGARQTASISMHVCVFVVRMYTQNRFSQDVRNN